MKFLKTLLASILGTLIGVGLLFFFGFLLILAIAASADQQPSVRSGSILVVELSGVIPERVTGDPFNQLLLDEPSVDLHAMIAGIEAAAEDSRIEGLWLRTGTLTSAWSTLEAVRRALVSFKESGKPVYASSKMDLMEEDEYFLASVADSVFLSPEALFFYNGFGMSSMYFAEMLEKLNVEVEVVRAGTYKSAAEPFMRQTMSAENEEQLMALVRTTEDTFTSAVGESRGIAPDELAAMTRDNPLFSAADAFDAGLIDVLGFNADVRAAFNARMQQDADEDLTTIAIGPYQRARRPGGASSSEIAVVHIAGTITSGEGSEDEPFATGVIAGSETVARALAAARESDRTRAVVVRVDSPGGFAPAADAMLHAIERTGEDVPVIISMGSLAASGGYWLAMGGDEIIAEANTITGSIGVFSLFVDASGFLDEKLGINYESVTSSSHADMFSGMRTYSAAERALVQRSTDRTYANFLEVVAASRDMTIQEVDAVAQGRVWSGRDALEVGLVDELGGLDRALELAAERAGLEPDSWRVRTYPREKTFIEKLSGSMSTVQAATMARLSGSSLIEWTRTRKSLVFLQQMVQSQASVQAYLPMTFDVQ